MKKLIVFCIMFVFALLFFVQAKAQEEPKLKVNPVGRVLVDGGFFLSDNKALVSGAAIPDVRVGVKASYGRFKAKVDIGYAYGKVGMKDVFIEGQMTSNSLLRIGNFVPQFGLQSATSSSMKIAMEEPGSSEAFGHGRLIGMAYVFSKKSILAAADIFVESESLLKKTSELGKTGYGAMVRFVYRPFYSNKFLFHVGLSGAYDSPRYNSIDSLNHSSFNLGVNFPTRIAKVKAIGTVVDKAKYQFRTTPELLAAYGPVALESQYYFVWINRGDSPSYKASGAYCMLRGLILGGDYKYSLSDCGMATPAPKSLECVLGYNYTDLSDARAEIYGGRLNDVSFTLNYYLNKYVIWRFRYSYTWTIAGVNSDIRQDVNTFETRFQIIF